MVQNVGLPFWKLLAYACQIEILETLVCLMLTLNVETVLLLDVLRLQMSSTVILIYSMERSVSVNMIGYYLLLLVHNFINCLNLRSCSKNNVCVWIMLILYILC
jgi:hypothetical protein